MCTKYTKIAEMDHRIAFDDWSKFLERSLKTFTAVIEELKRYEDREYADFLFEEQLKRQNDRAADLLKKQESAERDFV